MEDQTIQNTRDIADMRADHKILADQVNKMAQALESGFGNVAMRFTNIEAKIEKWILRFCIGAAVLYLLQVLPPEKLAMLLDKAPAIIEFIVKLLPATGA